MSVYISYHYLCPFITSMYPCLPLLIITLHSNHHPIEPTARTAPIAASLNTISYLYFDPQKAHHIFLIPLAIFHNTSMSYLSLTTFHNTNQAYLQLATFHSTNSCNCHTHTAPKHHYEFLTTGNIAEH